MNRFAELGHGISIGHQSACKQAGEFTRGIHINDPGAKLACREIEGHLYVILANKTDLGRPLIEAVYEYAKNDDRLLVHCGAGMHRSPTLSVIALVARGLTLWDAVREVVKATCSYAEGPIFPWLHHSSFEEIRRVLSEHR